ncbi:MAG TPA: citrate lyase subunit gamma [candidate division Zixibacteria bacterium]|nr:citrate lyase subunit gamma [candidate division Zixibacteria bacterium]
MIITKTAVAGKKTKGDIEITIRPFEERTISLTSSIDKLYGTKIKAEIEAELDRLGVMNASVVAVDDGALDYVISARVEAAVIAASDDPAPFKAAKEDNAIEIDRLRRSRLYIPGNNPNLFVNAPVFGADMILLDLEDSVPPSEKHATRYLVRNLLLTGRLGASEAAVRINQLSGPFGLDDIEIIAPAGPSIIALPKAETAQDVRDLTAEIERIQQRAGTQHKIGIMPIIESALGVVNAPEIASADGVVVLAFGAEDFTKDIGAERTRDGKEQLFARQSVICAAKAFGRLASDTVFSDFGDTEGLIESTREGKALGFDGRGLIHPGQVAPVHEVYTPSPDELLFAVKVVAAAERAEAEGSGVVAIGSKMIDAPIVARAQRVIATAEKLAIPLPSIEEEK